MFRLLSAFQITLGIVSATMISTCVQAEEKFNSNNYHAWIAPLVSQSLLLDSVNLQDKIIAVGERGHIIRSDDGIAWTQVSAPTNVLLTGVYFYDHETGWVTGHDATILRTKDAGKTWERVNVSSMDESPLLDIWFKDEKNGIAIGAYGLYLITHDGGNTWQQADFNPIEKNMETITDENDDTFIEYEDLHLNRITEDKNGRLYIVTEAGKIFRSSDSGETWHALPSPYSGSLFGLLVVEEDTLLVFGLRGHLYRSEDGGHQWQKIQTRTSAMLTDGLITSSGTIYICGLGGTLLSSLDGGKTFTTETIKTRNHLTSLFVNQDRQLIGIGSLGITPLINVY